MPYRTPTVVALAREASHVRSLALQVIRETGRLSPTLARLNDASRTVMQKLEALDQMRLSARYLIDHQEVSRWRREEARVLGRDGAVDIDALVETARTVHELAEALVRDDDTITPARRHLLSHSARLVLALEDANPALLSATQEHCLLVIAAFEERDALPPEAA